MADPAQSPRTTAPRSCPECGIAVAAGQRRCTNCGADVEVRRRLPRRTPLVAAVAVLAAGGAAAVVAQADVTDGARERIEQPAVPGSAPVEVAGNALPAAERPTSTKPKEPEVDDGDLGSSLGSGSIGDSLGSVTTEPSRAPTPAPTPQPTPSIDGNPVDSDTGANPDDLQEPRSVTIAKASNYDPDGRVGVEFGKPKAAIDDRSRTVWDVNVPNDGKGFGVGIVLDLGETKRVSALKIGTPTPGFGVVLYRTDQEQLPDRIDGRWTRSAKETNVSDDVVIPLAEDSKWARYVLVWLYNTSGPDDTRAAISNLEVLP